MSRDPRFDARDFSELIEIILFEEQTTNGRTSITETERKPFYAQVTLTEINGATQDKTLSQDNGIKVKIHDPSNTQVVNNLTRILARGIEYEVVSKTGVHYNNETFYIEAKQIS